MSPTMQPFLARQFALVDVVVKSAGTRKKD
jgi:hypothetical protein